MEMAPGKSIDSPDFTPQQRREMALAYTMVELTNLMSGKAWDIDRHSKQQNFHITKDKNGKTIVEIGIFDTGAQRAAPTDKEKELLGKFLIAVFKEQQKGKDSNLSEFMLAKIKKFEKAGKDVNYVSDVQRGLLAISDVMKHMNTPENPNGMAEGLKTCFEALWKNNLIDKKLYNTLIKETAKSMLTNPKFGKSVVQAFMKPSESKDKIEINLSHDNIRAKEQIKASVQANKPEHETEKIELEKTRIRPKPLTPREKVEKFLASKGFEIKTVDGKQQKDYMLLTPDDAWLKTQYNQEGRSIESYFNHQAEATEKKADMLMGTNNGYTAIYFAKENIYVVSPSYKLASAMYYEPNCKNVGYGVMFSNGECFVNSDAKNQEWKDIVKRVNEQEKTQEHAKSKEEESVQVAPKQEISSEEEKKKRVLELSGRMGKASDYIQQSPETIQQTIGHKKAQTEQTQTATQVSPTTVTPQSQATALSHTEPSSTESQEKVNDLKGKAKWQFFKDLRNGVNQFLVKAGIQLSQEKTISPAQVQVQNNISSISNVQQMKMTKDKGMGR